jgi:hypothetical protein
MHKFLSLEFQPPLSYFLTLKKAVGSFETTNTCQTTGNHISEDNTLLPWRRQQAPSRQQTHARLQGFTYLKTILSYPEEGSRFLQVNKHMPDYRASHTWRQYPPTLKNAEGSFETTNMCQTTGHHIPEDSTFLPWRRQQVPSRQQTYARLQGITYLKIILSYPEEGSRFLRDNKHIPDYRASHTWRQYFPTLKKTAGSFETTNMCQTTGHHIPEDSALQKFFISSLCSYLGLFHPPVSGDGGQYPWGLRGQSVKLPTHLHLMPKLKLWNCTSGPLYPFTLWCLGTRARRKDDCP